MCKHTAWLGLATGSHGTILLEFNRLQALLALGVFPNPSIQTPSLITFVGDRCKTRTIRKLISHGTFNNRGRTDVHIHVYPPTVGHESPLLLADYTFPGKIPHEQSYPDINCHQISRRSLSWTNQLVQELPQEAVAESLLSHLLVPFTDVVCLFSLDLGGLVGVAEMLEALMRKGHASTMSRSIRPIVFVVVENPSLPPHIDLVETQLLLAMLQESFKGDISAHFSRLVVMCTPPRKQLALLGYVIPAVEEMQKRRREARSLFSLQHFAALFRNACDHFSETATEPLDFVKFSRLQNPVPQAFSQHLTEFLGQLTSEANIIESGIPLIASSILLDSNPPGMHVFDPVDIFRLFYRNHCKVAIQAHLLSEHAIRLSNLLESHFKDLILRFEKGRRTSSELHCETLAGHRQLLKNLRSESTCFVCLGRGPERGLPCGHAVCEICVQVFGHPVFAEPYTFMLNECLLCGTSFSGFKTRIKPPTAGVRVLSIDGGGIRGVIPLSTLLELEKTISHLVGFHYPIQENFDLAYGTSSGGLIVLGLFLNGWSVEECLEKFVILARRAFSPRNIAHIPILHEIQDFMISYVADSQYGATSFEDALQEVFGTSTMLDWSELRKCDFGTKVAVTATTIENSSPCVFSNYNGIGTRSAECGYRMVKDNSRKVSVWEAARCTSAAPWFFKPKSLPGLGTFQDGGLRHNNPVNIALWESGMIWPEKSILDIVMSMGTGSQAASGSETKSLVPRGIWKDGFIPRLVRSFLSSMDGEDTWQQLCNRLPKEERGKYFRFNVKFDGKEPTLDDISKMHELEQKGRVQINLEQKVSTAESLIAKQFYFELDALPIYSDGRYQCTGRVLCRFTGAQQASLLSRLSQDSAYFLLGARPMTGVLQLPTYCRIFQEKIQFSVKNLEEEVTILLRSRPTKPQAISGFPTSMKSLIRCQGLDAAFGTFNHSRPGGLDSAHLAKRRCIRVW